MKTEYNAYLTMEGHDMNIYYIQIKVLKVLTGADL